MQALLDAPSRTLDQAARKVGVDFGSLRVHFMRNVLAKVLKANAEMVAAAIRAIFAQPDAEAVAAEFERIAATLESQFPDVTAHASRSPPRPPRLCRRPAGALAQGVVDQPRAPTRR